MHLGQELPCVSSASQGLNFHPGLLISFFISLPRCGAEEERGAVGLESCQQSDIKNGFKLFMTEDIGNKWCLKSWN